MTHPKSKGATKRKQPINFAKWLKRITVVSALCFVVVGVYFFARLVSGVSWKPLAVAHYELMQNLVYQDQQEVDELLQQFEGESLLFLNLVDVKLKLELLPWVKSASVMKQWPGTLIVGIQEHEPVAFWNESRVLNSEGMPLLKPFAKMELALLNGPQGQSEQVMERYLQFAQIFNGRTLKVTQVKKEPRGSWALILSNGIEVKLGEEHVLERSRRVVKMLTAKQNELASIEYIDARYPNGIAIKYSKDEVMGATDDIAA